MKISFSVGSFLTVLIIAAVSVVEPSHDANGDPIHRGRHYSKDVTAISACNDTIAAFYDPCSCAVYGIGEYYIFCDDIASPDLIQRAFARTTIRDHASLRITFDQFSSLPANVISDKRVSELKIACSESVTEIGPFSADAFRSSQDFTKSVNVNSCNIQSFNFVSGFSSLNQLFVSNTIISSLRDMPALAGLTDIVLYSNGKFTQWYFPPLTPNIKSVSISYSLDDQSAANVLEGLTYYAATLEVLSLNNNGLTQVPYGLQFLHELKSLDLANNELGMLKSGSLDLPSKLDSLYLYQAGIKEIETGALKGDFSSTVIHLSMNNFTRFEYGTFFDVISTMNTGYIDLGSNPIVCDCSVSWLIRDCPSFLSDVRYGVCSNETRFEWLNPDAFADCPVECVP